MKLVGQSVLQKLAPRSSKRDASGMATVSLRENHRSYGGCLIPTSWLGNIFWYINITIWYFRNQRIFAGIRNKGYKCRYLLGYIIYIYTVTNNMMRPCPKNADKTDHHKYIFQDIIGCITNTIVSECVLKERTSPSYGQWWFQLCSAWPPLQSPFGQSVATHPQCTCHLDSNSSRM